MTYLFKFWLAFLLSLLVDAVEWLWMLPALLWVAILHQLFRRPLIALINWLTKGMGLARHKVS